MSFTSCVQSVNQSNPSNFTHPASATEVPPASKRESGIRRKPAAKTAPKAKALAKRGRPRKVAAAEQPKPAPAPAAAPAPAPVERPRPPVKAPRPKPTAPRRRKVNYASASSRATVAKQVAMVELLRESADGLTVRDIAAHLHISRQLALYHVKKMVALGGCVAEFEAFPENGGIRLRVWDQVVRAERFVDWLDARTRPAISAPVAARAA